MRNLTMFLTVIATIVVGILFGGCLNLEPINCVNEDECLALVFEDNTRLYDNCGNVVCQNVAECQRLIDPQLGGTTYTLYSVQGRAVTGFCLAGICEEQAINPVPWPECPMSRDVSDIFRDVDVPDSGGLQDADVADAADGGDTAPDADVTDATDGGGDTTPDADVTDATDGGADTTPECGDTVCEDGEECEADCGSPDTFGRYVANFAPEDMLNVEGLNPGVTPSVEVNLPGLGWSRVASAGAFFDARAELEGLQWRVSVPSMPGPTGCAEFVRLPECRGVDRVCRVEWPLMVTRSWQEFTVDEGGSSPRVVRPTYECIWEIEGLPAPPEIFCPNTTTVVRVSEDGVLDTFCLEPAYLAASREILTQCRDQTTGTEYAEDCGLTTRSFLSGGDDPIWTVEQRIQATGATRRFLIRL